MIVVEIPELNISYKPQKISPKFAGTVRDLLNSKIRDAIFHPQFQTDVSRPLQIDNIIDQEVCPSCPSLTHLPSILFPFVGEESVWW